MQKLKLDRRHSCGFQCDPARAHALLFSVSDLIKAHDMEHIAVKSSSGTDFRCLCWCQLFRAVGHLMLRRQNTTGFKLKELALGKPLSAIPATKDSFLTGRVQKNIVISVKLHVSIQVSATLTSICYGRVKTLWYFGAVSSFKSSHCYAGIKRYPCHILSSFIGFGPYGRQTSFHLQERSNASHSNIGN